MNPAADRRPKYTKVYIPLFPEGFFDCRKGAWIFMDIYRAHHISKKLDGP